MQLFRAQLSRYIPHPHRDSWMRNNLAGWLQLLRLSSFFTLIGAAWNTFRTSSPLAITNEFQTIIELIAASLFPSDNIPPSISNPQLFIQYSFTAFLLVAAITSLRCGINRKLKYIIPVFIAGILLIITAAKHCLDSGFEIISIIPYLLPIATPFLLLSYRNLANKVDHWNYYANFLCVTTIFGNALTYLFYPDKLPHFETVIFDSTSFPSFLEEMAHSFYSYFAIVAALLTAFALTRRLGLYLLIAIGIISCVYRVLVLSLGYHPSLSFDLILADFFFYNSYWLIALLILLSLASRRKTQTLKL